MNEGDATTDGSLFEGLARAFKPEGAFAADLRAVGFDVKALQLRYSTAVLTGVLDVIHRHAYPALPREEAHRQTGQRMLNNFFETIFGRVVQTLLRALGLERFLIRLPKIAPMGTTGLEIRVEKDGPGALRLFFHGHSSQSGDFVAGALESGGRVASDQFRVELIRGGPTDFELRVTGLR